MAQAGIDVDVTALLDAAATAGMVQSVDVLRCPVAGCPGLLSPDDIANGICPRCETDLRELGDDPIPARRYTTGTQPSRDIPWFIAIHGMNTLGDWQQEFSWQIATKLRYSAPVLIYKYGLIRASVLLRWRHRALARQLGNRIRDAAAQARRNQIAEAPDVLIHSFGSQLFRLVLEMDEFADLTFGRVIAAGSVIRPDFDWTAQIAAGRIQSLLNHCAGKDLAVPLAQYFIPGCGPGGRHGFVDRSVTNISNPDFSHSSALRPEALAANLGRGGSWDRFLTAPPDKFGDVSRFLPGPWRPRWRVLRAVVRIVGVGTIVLALIVTIYVAALGILGLGDYVGHLICR
ncbi:hypothetical protein [Sphingopyxis fribergensis]